MVAKIWDRDLSESDRRTLLHAVHRDNHAFMIRLEVDMAWRDLLPSTQALLRDVDWCALLDRDVRPD